MIDKRQAVIDMNNELRRQTGLAILTPRQEHLIREFIADDGSISIENARVLQALLESNSA